MSRKRKTREQKINAQERRLKSIPNHNESNEFPIYSLSLEQAKQPRVNSEGNSKIQTSPVFLITDLYHSLITASIILVLSALLSLIIKRTDFLSFILN